MLATSVRHRIAEKSAMPVDAPGQSHVEQFGVLLRQHRVAATLSQEALAERAGVSARAVSDLERGVKLRPHLETVRMLADALRLSSTDRMTLAVASRPGTARSLMTNRAQ